MKAGLVVGGGPRVPNGDKLKRAGIKRVYYEAENPDCDLKLFNDLRGWGWEVGVMRAPNWHDDTPAELVKRANADIARLAPKRPDGSRPQLAYMLDIEIHDEAYVFEALTAFKAAQPGRNIIWTMEYHQGGWFSKRLVDLCNSYGGQLRLLPQCYYGDMDHAVDTHAAARDLYLPHGGIKDELIRFFYTCRVPVPLDWDGCLYIESWDQLP